MSELPVSHNEISGGQLAAFVAEVRKKLGPMEASYEPLTDDIVDDIIEDLPQLRDWIKQAQEGLKHVIHLYSAASYQLGENTVFVREADTIGLDYHMMTMAVTQPDEDIDDNYFRRDEIVIEVDLINNISRYEELANIYDRDTGRKQPTPIREMMAEEGATWEGVRTAVFKKMEQEEVLGLTVFSQERFSKAMEILEQLGEHNKID